MSKLCGFLFLTLICGAAIADSGVKTTLTQSGLNYLTQVGTTVLDQKLNNLPLGALTGVADTPVGKIAWQLLFMQMIGFSMTQTSIEIVPNSGLNFHIGELDAVITMEWHYKRLEWPHIGDKGIAIVAVHQVSSTVQVAISEANGRPVVKSVADAFNIGQLLIKLHGGASWLYRVFVDAFEPEIRKAINTNLQKAIPEAIDGGLAAMLATLPMTVPIDQHIELNYALTANPAFGAGYMTIPDAGEFLQIASPTPCPGNVCPQHPTPDTVSGQMLQFILSDFVPNSFTKVLFDMSRLGVVIRPTDVPSWSPVRLNTTDFKTIIPALYNKWPNHLLQVRLYCTQPPSTTFSQGGPSILANGNLELAVINNDGSLTPAFTLSGNASLSATVHLSGQDLSVQIQYVRSVYSLESSQIGTFPLSVLNDIIYDMFTRGLVPIANALLQTPIPLPVIQGITFNNPSLGWGAGFLYVSTDITLTVPDAKMSAIAIN